jgi:hypothetical protein
MEDLGQINININERGGGGGGGSSSGVVGGGPLARPNSNAIMKIDKAIIHINQAVIQQISQGFSQGISTSLRQLTGQVSRTAASGGSSSASSPPLSMFQRFLGGAARVEGASAIKGEFAAFLRAPSAGGLASLFSASSSTGTAIAGLGAAALPVAIALGALLVGIVAAITVYKILSASAERVARKFQEITRFSGAMMYASANERLAQFQRQLADATRNGAAYARAQLFATAAADAQAETMLYIDGAAAELAVVFNRMSLLFWKALKPLAQFVEFLAKAVDWGNVLITAFGMAAGPGGSVFIQILKMIYVQTAAVAKNTTPRGGAAINNWFMGDVQAITRKAYSGI